MKNTTEEYFFITTTPDPQTNNSSPMQYDSLLYNQEIGCRRREMLDQKLQLTKVALHQKRFQVKQLLEWDQERDRRRVQILNNRLHLIYKKISITKSHSKNIRQRIDTLIRENQRANLEMNFSAKSIKSVRKEIKTLDLKKRQHMRFAEHTSNKILNSTSVNSCKSFRTKKIPKEFTFKRDSIFITPCPRRRARTPPRDLLNSLKILHVLANKWQSKTKEKYNNLKKYLNRINKLKKSFRRMENTIQDSQFKSIGDTVIASYQQEMKMRGILLNCQDSREQAIKLHKNTNLQKEWLQKTKTLSLKRKTGLFTLIKSQNDKVYKRTKELFKTTKRAQLEINQASKLVQEKGMNSQRMLNYLSGLLELIHRLCPNSTPIDQKGSQIILNMQLDEIEHQLNLVAEQKNVMSSKIMRERVVKAIKQFNKKIQQYTTQNCNNFHIKYLFQYNTNIDLYILPQDQI